MFKPFIPANWKFNTTDCVALIRSPTLKRIVNKKENYWRQVFMLSLVNSGYSTSSGEKKTKPQVPKELTAAIHFLSRQLAFWRSIHYGTFKLFLFFGSHQWHTMVLFLNRSEKHLFSYEFHDIDVKHKSIW